MIRGRLLRLYDESECGADGYPFAWHQRIKHLIREQAGDRCIRCGHPYRKGAGEWSPCDERCAHGAPLRIGGIAFDGRAKAGDLAREYADGMVQARWRILTVHHLDEVKRNCRWWNLVALCQRCHLTVQGKVKLYRPWLLPHSAWFQPYVAGYYASAILGIELHRAQVMAQLDELLEMGRTGKVPERRRRRKGATHV